MWLGRQLVFEVIANFLWKTDKGTPTRKEDAREIKRLFLSSAPGRWSFWREVTEGAKRTGISWHLLVVYRPKQEELQWQTHIHTAKHPCTRGSSAVHPCSASVFSKGIRLREISLQSPNKVYNPLLMTTSIEGLHGLFGGRELFAYCLHSRPQLAIRKFTLFLKRDGIAEQQRKLVNSVLLEHMTLSELPALMYKPSRH